MYGSDQAASISCEFLRNLVETVRSVEKILGDGNKKVFDCEVSVRKKLRK